MGKRLYKLLLEALYRIKFHCLQMIDDILGNEETSILLEQIHEARINLDFDTFEGLSSSSQLALFQTFIDGDMAYWNDSFLEMVHLLLNSTHFHRTGNGVGYLISINKLLPYFSESEELFPKSYYYLGMLDVKRRNSETH